MKNLMIAALLTAGFALGGCSMMSKSDCCGKCDGKKDEKKCCGEDGKCCKKAEGHSHDHGEHGDHKHS